MLISLTVVIVLLCTSCFTMYKRHVVHFKYINFYSKKEGRLFQGGGASGGWDKDIPDKGTRKS